MRDYVLEYIDGGDTARVDQWAAQLAGLTNQFREYLLNLSPESTMRVYDEDAIREYAEANYGFVAARVDDRLVGSTWLVSSGEGTEAYAFIMMVYVEPEYRDCGIGRAMIERAEAILRERGCTSVELEIAVYNIHVAGFYERMGYSPNRVVNSKSLVA